MKVKAEMQAAGLDCAIQEGLKISAELRALAADPLRLTLVDSLLRRAAEARPGVAEFMVKRASVHLQTLQCALQTGDADAAVRSPRSDPASGWQQLVEEMHQSQYVAVVEINARDRLCREQEQVLFESLGMAGASELNDQNTNAEDTRFPEMRAAVRLRNVKARQQSQRRVSRALAVQPESPGPLNPQMLAIKALSQMQDLSPQYLERFVSYLDTLMLLAQQESDKTASKPGKKPGKARRGASRKK